MHDRLKGRQIRVSWPPARLIFCCRLNPVGDSIPFLACLRFGLQNIAMQSNTSWLTFSVVRWVLRLIRSRLRD